MDAAVVTAIGDMFGELGEGSHVFDAGVAVPAVVVRAAADTCTRDIFLVLVVIFFDCAFVVYELEEGLLDCAGAGEFDDEVSCVFCFEFLRGGDGFDGVAY